MSETLIPLSQVLAIIASFQKPTQETFLPNLPTLANQTVLAETPSPNQTERPVIVTTAHRGVFFGYATDIDGDVIELKRARLAVYWSKECKGFMGLASNGPDKLCRIGLPADIKLRNITAVLSVTDEAVKAWERAPWTS